MKKTILTLVSMLAVVSAFAQGTVNFNNLVGPSGNRLVDARFIDTTGAGLGAGWTAELVLVSGGSVTQLATSAFRTSSAAAQGYILPAATGTTVTVPNVAGGTSATLQMRAYNGASYASSSLTGASPEFQVILGNAGTPPSPAADLTGLGLTPITIVPEPSTIALAVIGMAGLFFARRRK